MRRIAIGGIAHETNTFAPIQTPLNAFTVDEGEGIIKRWTGTHSSLGGVIQGLQDSGYEVVPLLYATAMPSGLVTAEAYQTLRDHLVGQLASFAPVDGVLLVLHGAMVAQGQDDCEGEILEQVRAAVNCPVVAVLDMHGCLTQKMVDAADGLVAYNQNPHLDTYERGLEATALLHRILEDGAVPTHAFRHLPLLLNALTTGTDREPLKAIHKAAQAARSDARVLSISIMGGFAYSDVPDAGVSVLVTTNNDLPLAQRLLKTLTDIAWENREAALDTGIPVAEAVKRALSSQRFPVILADIGDNVGGGSPGDGTVLLRALIEAAAQDAVVLLADPDVLQQAITAGVGTEIDVSVGAKVDDWHGEPISIRVVVENLTNGQYATSGKDHFSNVYGRAVNMEGCARLRHSGIVILISGRKTPPGDLEQLRSQGIDIEAQKIIVVKSTIAFRGAYEAIAGDIIEVDTPGLCAANLTGFTYHKLHRPIYPLDVLNSITEYRTTQS